MPLALLLGIDASFSLNHVIMDKRFKERIALYNTHV